jgi:NADPH2:quinone reductase
MVAAVRVHKVGGPEVLTYEEIEVGAPGQGQIRVKQHACGVNFIDTYFRMGMYPSPVGLPFVAGNEAAGEVTAVGPGVTEFKVGDRVAYVVALGCYAAERSCANGPITSAPMLSARWDPRTKPCSPRRMAAITRSSTGTKISSRA